MWLWKKNHPLALHLKKVRRLEPMWLERNHDALAITLGGCTHICEFLLLLVTGRDRHNQLLLRVDTTTEMVGVPQVGLNCLTLFCWPIVLGLMKSWTLWKYGLFCSSYEMFTPVSHCHLTLSNWSFEWSVSFGSTWLRKPCCTKINMPCHVPKTIIENYGKLSAERNLLLQLKWKS
jgi:hypothetical protein